MPDIDAAPALLSDGFRGSNASVHEKYAALAAFCLRWHLDLPPRDAAALLASRDHGGDWDELARRLRREARAEQPHQTRGRKS